MSVEGSQPLKVSLPVSAALAQALFNEDTTVGPGTGPPAQYTFVIVNASGQADLVANASDIPIGVIQNKPFVTSQGGSQLGGGAAEIVTIGVTKIRLGGTITLAATSPGNMLEFSVATNHVGTAIQAGAISGGTKVIVGQAMAAGVSGNLTKCIVSVVIPCFVGN
jgi:hypothetical protein